MINFRNIITDSPRNPVSLTVKVLTAGVILIGISAISWTVLASTTRNWEVLWKYRAVFWQGWLLTVEISAAALVFSSAIGLVAALAKRSRILFVRYLATVYVEMIRGMPFLVLILILFYGFPQITQYGNRMAFGILALSLFSGAYLAEMMRAGIESVGASQRESARAIGLTSRQTYQYVIFPQALRHTLPALTGQFASLIKDSSLLSIIGLTEFTFAAQQVASTTLSTMESFLPLGVGYLVLTIPISLWTRNLEKKLRYET